MAFRKLSPSDLEGIFGPKDRIKATQYAHRAMRNPATPPENAELIAQYVEAHPEKFLTDAEVNANPGLFKTGQRRYRDRSNGRVYGSYGFSHDNMGRTFDRYGNEVGGWSDGGIDPREYGFVTADQYVKRSRGFFRKREQKPIDQPRSVEELGKIINGINNPLRGRLYLDSIIENPNSNIETVDNAIALLDLHRDRLATDEQVAEFKANREKRKAEGTYGTSRRSGWGSGGYGGNGGRRQGDPPRSFWSRFWKSQEEFDAMSPKEKKFFVRAYKNKNHARTASYFLKVLVNRESSPEDKEAVVNVVNKHPGMVFKTYGRDGDGRGKE